MKNEGLPRSRSDKHETKQDRLVTGRELTELEELSTRINTLIDILDQRGILNLKEFERIVAMRLHEVSKATAFEGLDEEL
jgi:hypothetical protein